MAHRHAPSALDASPRLLSRSSRSISVLGLTLGVAMLIVVLSVMNGFERELRSRILSVTAHATLMGIRRHDRPTGARRSACAERAPGGASRRCRTSRRRRMLANGQRVTGVDGARRAAGAGARQPWASRSTSRGGTLDCAPGRRATRSMLGGALAQELRVACRRRRRAHRAARQRTPAGVVPRMRRFHVSRHSSIRHVRVRQRAGAGAHAGRRAPLSAGRRGHGHAPALQDPLRSRRALVRSLARQLGGQVLRERLDAQPRQLLPLHPDHEIDDVHHPADDRRGRRDSTSSRRW